MTRAGLVLATICTAAASGAEIHWSELAKVVKGKTLVVATKKGETYEGRFVSSLPDSIVLKDTQEVKIERDSIKNKKAYARRWGYELEMVDMSTKKKYAHEWRESWEKVDMIREAMRKYPRAEW